MSACSNQLKYFFGVAIDWVNIFENFVTWLGKISSKSQNCPPQYERSGQIERPVLRLMKVYVRIFINAVLTKTKDEERAVASPKTKKC
jgi:hypothetical protein